jgi:hypothetical protein
MALSVLAPLAAVAEFNVVEVPAIGPGELRHDAIAFFELRDSDASSPAGLVAFETWANTKPLQKELLSPYPGYTEPLADVTVEGVTRRTLEKLRMYVAEARFTVSRAPDTIDLARYATVNFIERLDPAIKHEAITAGEADNISNKHPDRKWCEAATCVRSKYRLEGKLPMAVMLVKQLTDDDKLTDMLEFQSELRVLRPPELDQDALRELTGIDASVTGVIEQNIFHINQIMQFGKFLAVFQGNPEEPNETIITAYIALALKARLLEQAKKYGNVPILRNLVPAMVLAGKSSFNAGNSISAGLPVFARNNVKAVASILEGPRPTCPSCFPLAACPPKARMLKLDDAGGKAMPASLKREALLLEPDLLQPCRPDLDPFVVTKTCSCRRSMLREASWDCAKAPRTSGARLLNAPAVCDVAAISSGRVAALACPR